MDTADLYPINTAATREVLHFFPSIAGTKKVRLFHPNPLTYSVFQKDGLNFVRLYFLNYTWYENNLHNV